MKSLKINSLNIVMLLPIILSFIVFKNSEMLLLYKRVVDIFCIAISFSISILTLSREDIKKYIFFRILGISFFIIGIFLFLQIVILLSVFNKGNKLMYLIELVILCCMHIYFILALRNRKKNRIIIRILFGTLLIIGFIIGSNFVHTYEGFILINSILVGIMEIYLFVLIILVRDQYKYKNILFIYLFSLCIYSFLTFSSIYGGNYIYVIRYVAKYLIFYIAYYLIQNEYYYKSYITEKNRVRDIEVRNLELNAELRNKNRELSYIKKSLEKSEAKKKKLLDEINDAIIMISFGRITYINLATMKRLKGIKREEVIGMKYEEISKYSKNEFEFKEINIENKNYFDKEIKERNLYKISRLISEDSEFDIYFLKLNKTDGVIYCKDITMINENRRIRREYEKYLKEEKLKEEFYVNISHELRTPINIIFSAIQLNSIHLRERNALGIIKNNMTIKQNSLRLIRTINNFIDANKASEGFLKLNKTVENIVYVVENISIACSEYLERIDNNLIFDSEEEEIYAEIDKDMIERVILNLLSNMVKYGKNGGDVKVNISTLNDDIIIEVGNDNYIIDEEIIPFLFDKFNKLNKALNRKREGSGLGLYLSKAIIELHNGTIEVESNSNIGTKFIIKVPKYKGDCSTCLPHMIEVENINHKVETEFSDIYL